MTLVFSWIAFSLGPQAITPRTMIGVNALLSMIFHFGSIMKNLPRVSYIKAIGTSFSLVSDFLLSVSLLHSRCVDAELDDICLSVTN